MQQVGLDEFLKRPVGTGLYMVQGGVKDLGEVSEGEVYALWWQTRTIGPEGIQKLEGSPLFGTRPRRLCAH